MKGTKEALIKEINRHKCWVCIKEIDRNLNKQMDKTTIYRNLKKLVETGDILEDFNLNGEKVFKIKWTHHHHFYCTTCHNKVNIGCGINEFLNKIQEDKWVVINSHTFVLSWICNECKEM